MDIQVRLIFDDPSILSQSQISEGMNKTWLSLQTSWLLKIHEVSNYIMRKFNLHDSCPNGILLSDCDGFVFPPFEHSRLLKNKATIKVMRKGMASAEATQGLDEEVNREEPVDNGVLLLANEEFAKETGGHQSESEDAKMEKTEVAPSPKETPTKKLKGLSSMLVDDNFRRKLLISF